MCETRQVNSQVNGLHIDGHEYEIVDKFCYLSDMLNQEGGRLVEVQGAFRPAYRKRDESVVKRNYLYNMHKTCNVVWQ